ncbi:unnamed protein product [Mucor hiemalis]
MYSLYMNFKFFAVYLVFVVFCLQPVFGFISVIFDTISKAKTAIDFIKSHLPGDENKPVERVSVANSGYGCSHVIQKLKGKNTYIDYHVDHDPVYDIIYSAANNGHTYGKVIQTLKDKLEAQGRGDYVFEVATVNARKVNKQYSCPGTPTKWTGKWVEYDYHVVLSNKNRCAKNWSELKATSARIKKEVDDYNRDNNRC